MPDNLERGTKASISIGEALQFEAIITDPPPFKEVSVWGKQVRLDSVDPDIHTIFSNVFDSFDETATTQKHERRKALIKAAETTLFGSVILDHISEHGLERRFAGDSSLPRSKYWTLCPDETGDDGGTLIFELLHYCSVLRSGLVGVLDTTLSECREFSARFYGLEFSDSRLLVELLPFYDEPNPTAARLIPDMPPDAPVLFEIPLHVQKLHFEHAIDLRDFEVARWFASALSKLRWGLEGGIILPAYFPGPPSTEDFLEVLPSLLNQAAGGSDEITQVAGLMLRRLGADALIFPSARSSASTIADESSVVARSWNVVQYDQSNRSIVSVVQMALEDWPTKIVPECETGPIITCHQDNDGVAVWSVNGLRSYNHYRRLRNELILLARHHKNEPYLSEIESALNEASYNALDASLVQFSGVEPYALFYLHARLRKKIVDAAP